jgi:predicted small secreted protein
MTSRAVIFLLLVASFSFLTACGGSGGGDDTYAGAARVHITASPTKIDSGDRTKVSIDVSEVHENGIALKVRYPEGLSYVVDSAILEVNQREIDLAPAVNETIDGDVYLVIYITQSMIDEGEQGTIVIELEGYDKVNDGRIAVDPDVDDPLVANATEFNAEDPQFDEEDGVDIQVIDNEA